MKDEKQFFSLYLDVLPALKRFIFSQIPDLHSAQDVLQEVSVVIWNKFNKYEDGTNFKAWVLAIARYEILHAKRSYVKDQLVSSPKLLEKFARHYEGFGVEKGEEKRVALEHCYKKLSDKNKKLLQSRYWQDMSYSEISEKQGGRENTLRIKIYRIKKTLKNCIENYM
ncbi:MAG: sigma-70 family RNA polymerase sigma factor [Verrucomicrobiota bacterium]|nr:sigma-70 family RNA polymerase sigma factor [Verrucomicrobiota bacterium]